MIIKFNDGSRNEYLSPLYHVYKFEYDNPLYQSTEYKKYVDCNILNLLNFLSVINKEETFLYTNVRSCITKMYEMTDFYVYHYFDQNDGEDIIANELPSFFRLKIKDRRFIKQFVNEKILEQI